MRGNRLRLLLTGGIVSSLVVLLAGCTGTQPMPTFTTLPVETQPAAGATTTSSSESIPAPSAEEAEAAGGGMANADVTFVRAEQAQNGTWTFHVTVQHPDTGWEDYADGWDVVTPDGTVLKTNPAAAFTRTLLHPHQDEQPFTRSQSGLTIPPNVQQVTVRAHDLVDGYGGQEVVVDLSQASGPNFEVIRQSAGGDNSSTGPTLTSRRLSITPARCCPLWPKL